MRILTCVYVAWVATLLFFAGCSAAAVGIDESTTRSQVAGVLAMATLVVEPEPTPQPAPPKPGRTEHPVEAIAPVPQPTPEPVEAPRLKVDRKYQAIVFLSKDCAPCARLVRETFPTLRKVGWTISDLDDPADAHKGEIWTIYADEGFGKAVGKDLGVEGFPTTLVLDSSARVAGRLEGFKTADSYSAWLNRFSWR